MRSIRSPLVLGLVLALCLGLAACSNGEAPASSSKGSTGPGSSGKPGSGGSGGPTLATARGGHTATLLSSGDVVVAGGQVDPSTATDSVEVFGSGAFRAAGSLSTPRVGHEAVLLPSGEVWILGGQNQPRGGIALSSTDIVDAAGNARPGPSLQAPRTAFAAVAFRAAGRDLVLVAGGAEIGPGGRPSPVLDAEVYEVDPSGISLLGTVAMGEDHLDPAVARLSSGEILVQGGHGGLASGQLRPAGAELFDPAQMAFRPAGSLAADRSGTVAVAGPAGAFVIGGHDGQAGSSDVSSYDVAAGSFSRAASLAEARWDHAGVLLQQGAILVAGGRSAAGVTDSVEVVDAQGARSVAALQVARAEPTLTELPSGEVLVCGGLDAQGRGIAGGELYRVGSGSVSGPISGNPSGGQPTAGQGPPRLVYLWPDHGHPRDIITVVGSSFATSAGNPDVRFDGVSGNVIGGITLRSIPVFGQVSTMAVEVPQGARTGDVTVEANGMVSNPRTFVVDPPNQNRPDPEVVLVLPGRGDPGDLFTIFGRNFAPSGQNTVTISGVQAYPAGAITSQSLPFIGNVSAMLGRVPQGAVTGDLVVEAWGNRSDPVSFEVPGTQPHAGGGSGSSGGSATGGSGGSGGTSGSAYFADDFEGGTWMTQLGQPALWEVDTPSFGAASGQQAVGTGFSGPYPAGSDTWLVTPDIDLSQAQAPELVLEHRLDLAAGDAARILVTADGGQSYYYLEPDAGYPSTAGVFAGDPAWTGSTGGWTPLRADLSAWAGEPAVAILFELKTDASAEAGGWFLDDLRVREGSGSGGSTASSGSGGSSGSSGSSGSTGGQVVFADGFEGGTSFAQNQGGIWELGDPSTGTGTPAPEGSSAVGTRLDASYDADVNSTLSARIDLRGLSSATLSFRHRYDIEDGWDGARVLVTDDGGQTYYRLDPASGSSYAPSVEALGGASAWSGSSNGWEDVAMDLSWFAGREVTVVFQFASDASIQDLGWYIDDVRVSGR